MDDRPDTESTPASESTLAALEIHGRVLRYGEVVRAEGQGHGVLRRLGTCDFEFDVAEAVFGDAKPQNFDTVIEAVSNIYSGSSGPTLRVAVHPPALTGFFTPLPERMSAADRHEQLRQEAALLADVNAAQPVRIRAVPIRSEDVGTTEPEPHRWHHVFHIPESVHARMTLLGRALDVGTYEVVDTTRATASVVSARDGMVAGSGLSDQPETPYTLVLGAYNDHVELGVVHDGAWFHGHHGPAGDPDDAAYFAAALLDRIGVGTGEVGRFLLYGEIATPSDFRLLAGLLDRQPVLFDPLDVFGHSQTGAPPELLAKYVPCVGALLS